MEIGKEMKAYWSGMLIARNRSSSLLGADSFLSTDLSNFNLAVEQVITLTNSSCVGVRKETDSLKTSASTPITSSSSELDQANSMLSVRSKEAAEWASGCHLAALSNQNCSVTHRLTRTVPIASTP